MNRKKVLFLCTHNAAHSQMAESLLNARYGGQYEAQSADTYPTEVHPCAIRVMAELGVDISKQRAKSLRAFDDAAFDCVVTMMLMPQRAAQFFCGGANYLRHPFDNPTGLGNTHRFDACVTKSENGSSRPSVKVEPRLMHRVFSNLILNAIQAMPDGGVTKRLKRRMSLNAPLCRSQRQ
jgi:arsenate reductase